MKKLLFSLLLISTLITQAIPAQAAITALGFNFTTTLTSAGKTYYVDMVTKTSAGATGSDEMTDGSYDMRVLLGFYGAKADIDSDDFIDNVFDVVTLKIKQQGASAYIGEAESQASQGSVAVQNYSGRVAYSEFLSHAGFGFVNPGKYTADAILNNKIIKSVDVCLPTFTSNIGKSIGNETCGGAQPPTPTPTATTTATTTVPTSTTTSPTSSTTTSVTSATTTVSTTSSTTTATSSTTTNSVTITADSSKSTDPCSKEGANCYTLYSGFSAALDRAGNKFSALGNADDIGGFINAIIAFGIGLGGILAVVMIMYEGFLYMKSDNVNTKTTAKSRIINTVIGFLLLLSIYTLLRTINPDLLGVSPRVDYSKLSDDDKAALSAEGYDITDPTKAPTKSEADKAINDYKNKSEYITKEYIPARDTTIANESKGLKTMITAHAIMEGYYKGTKSYTTNNPGNLGNVDDGSTVTYSSLAEGITAQRDYVKKVGSNQHPAYKLNSHVQKPAVGTYPAIDFVYNGSLDQYLKIYSTSARLNNSYIQFFMSYAQKQGLTITPQTTVSQFIQMN